MDEPPEEAPGESFGHESTAKPPTAVHTNNQEEDKKNNQAEEKADDETDNRRAGQPSQRVSDQAEPHTLGQPDHIEDGVYNQRSHEQTEANASSQADNVADGQIDHQVSDLTDQSTFEQTEQRLSSQAVTRASQQIDRRSSSQADHQLSSVAEGRASEQNDHSTSTQGERKFSEQIDHRLYGQETSEETDHRLPRDIEKETYEKTTDMLDHVDHGTSEKAQHQVYNQATKLAEQEAVDYSDSHADQRRVGKDDYGEYDQDINKQANYEKDYLSDYERTRVFPEFSDAIEDKEAGYRIEPCKFEDSQTDFESKLSGAIETESESATIVQACDPDDDTFTYDVQAKDKAFDKNLPSTSAKSEHATSQEKPQATIISTSGPSEAGQRKSSHRYSYIYKRRFPSLVYEDPYQLSLQYMEKHNILQIFQITENLVFEKPEDPLNFMLCQVQEMMRNRDKM